MARRRVVVTGVSAISPLGNTARETWEGAIAGKSGVGQITRFDAAAYASHIAAEVKNFDPAQFIELKEIKKLDLFSQYVIGCAKELWENAGFTKANPYNPARSGCILGIGIGGLSTLERVYEQLLKDGPRRVTPFFIPAMISNLGPGHVAIKYGLKGINFVVTSACASGTHALGESYRMIADGVQDMMVTGGSEAAVTPSGIGGFCAMKALSTRNDEPQKASRPFDKDRDGFVLGEGAALFVLEDFETAKKRGAHIYAEVIGYGASCDAYHITAPCVDGEGAVSCMKNALESAQLKPEDVQYINAHGTSTEANDLTETAAIKQVFGEWAKQGLMVSSTKSMTGHLLGAAGAIEALFSVMAIDQGIVPPTINLDNPAEGCDLDYVPHTARKTPVKAVMSNSFGFGGTNASIVFGAVR